MNGWTGKRAVIDLTNRSVVVEDIDESVLKQYLGGRGLNVKVLYDMTSAKTRPFDPDNPLIIGTGPVTGTLIPTNCRYNITSKSPLTGILGDGNPAGFWAAELKYAGFDQLVVVGKSTDPIYLWVNNGKVEIRDARHLWGRDIWDTDKTLKAELGERVQVASIGQAGENKVRYACVINNLKRAAGRTGMGAVMGDKKIKAIAVRGTQPVTLAHPVEHKKVLDEMLDWIYKAPGYPHRSKLGTTIIVDLYIERGILPVRNAQESVWDEASKFTSHEIAKHTKNLKGCFSCPIHCSRYTTVEEGEFAGTCGEGPEFETIVALGVRCGNANLDSVLKANQLLNQYGLDSISTGGVISFIMECYQRGLVTKSQLDDLDISWGNYKTILELIRKIAFREGCGDWLAEGVKRLSEDIPGSEEFAMHVKGLEPAEQEPRGLKAWGLGWAVSSRGADHLRAFPLAETTWTKEDAIKAFGTEKVADRFSYEGKPDLVKWSEEVSAVTDSMEMCKFSQMALVLPMEMTARALWSVTGWEVSAQELLQIGERIVNLERLFIVREGMGRADDKLPPRYSTPIKEGASKGETFEIEDMLDKYYQLRGWDIKSGHPTREKLKSLGLL